MVKTPMIRLVNVYKCVDIFVQMLSSICWQFGLSELRLYDKIEAEPQNVTAFLLSVVLY